MKLFISGIPSSGKTTFANWLRDEFGFMHIDFELLSGDFQQFLGQHQFNLRWLFAEMSRFSPCVVELGIPDSDVSECADARWF